MNETRCTQHHRQPILWDGNGIYKWNPTDGQWVHLSEEETVDYVRNPVHQRGLFLALTLENTLEDNTENSYGRS